MIAPKSFGRRLISAIAMLLFLVGASPYIIAKTPLRNVLLQQVGAKDGLSITSQSAEFGWFTPLILRGLRVEGEHSQMKVRIAGLHFSQSWFETWLTLPDIGEVAVTSPEIELLLREGPPVPRESKPPVEPIVGKFEVRDASFRVMAPRDNQEIIRMEQLDVTARIIAGESGRTLTIEPVKLLDQIELSPEMCDRGLQLVAPPLANSTSVSGSASLEITRCNVPLRQAAETALAVERIDIAGKLQLHHVQSSMKESIFRDLASIVAGLLRIELPDTMRIADGTEVRFEVRDGRVYHEGLTFLLPEVSPDMTWRTKGSVGLLDETLDLVVLAQIPFTLAGDGLLASRLAEQPIEIHIGGTLDQPKLELPRERNWLKEAAGALAGDDASGVVQPLAETVVDLLEQARARREENAASGAPNVLERMRERLRRGREQREQRTQPSRPPAPPSDSESISL